MLVESDMFFVGHDGVYRFNRYQRTDAHKWCLQVAVTAMENGVGMVLVPNVFCRLVSMEAYLRAARANGYRVLIHTFPTRSAEQHFERNTHGVPITAIYGMLNVFEQTPGPLNDGQPRDAAEVIEVLSRQRPSPVLSEPA